MDINLSIENPKKETRKRRKITKKEILEGDERPGLWLLGVLVRTEVSGETGRRVKNADGFTLMGLFLMFLGLAMEEDSLFSVQGDG